MSAPRRSPVHDQLDALGATWKRVGDSQVALRLAAPEQEQARFRTLALGDVSGLPTWGLKGDGAAPWLAEHQIEVPAEVYSTRFHTGNGVRVIRTGTDELLLESVPTTSGGLIQQWTSARHYPDGFFLYERQDAIFLLTGARAAEVLAQTCSIHWDKVKSDTLVMTRVAGVSCAILSVLRNKVPIFRIRLDPTYAIYLWEQLLTICRELGGHVIGAEVIFPEWFHDDRQK